MNAMNDYWAGLLLILVGLLVARFPMLIAGYNTMSKEERAKIDSKGLSRMMRKYLVIAGLFGILCMVLLNVLGMQYLKDSATFVLVIGVCILIIIKAQKYKLQ